MSDLITILQGDALEKLRELPDESIQCCVTSPPYWGLRDYGHAGQIGLEDTPDRYVNHLVGVFSEVRRVLRKDGTLWLNLGDSYAGSGKGPSNSLQRPHSCLNNRQLLAGAAPKEWIPLPSKGAKIGSSHGESGHTSGVAPPPGLKAKDLVGIPWMVAFALRADGWYLRSDIIWNKPNPMPESVTDRPTKSHEYLFLLTKASKYYYDADAIKEPCADASIARLGRAVSDDNKRSDGVPGQPRQGLDQPRLNVKFGGNKAEGYGTRIHSGRSWNPFRKEFAPRDAGSGSGLKGHNGMFDANGKLVGGGFANKKSVWTVATQGYREAHFATYPPDLIKPCILAGSRPRDVVLDCFGGSGTTGMVALELGRKALLIELNPEYCDLIQKRLSQTTQGLQLT